MIFRAISRRLSVFLVATLLVSALAAFAQKPPEQKPAEQKQPQKPKQTIYDFSLVGLDGKVVSLSAYKGKVVLLVNLASQSVYHSQIDALSDLAKSYESKGLVVLGIPSAEFGAQELKETTAVSKYYLDTAKVTFTVFAPATLTGVNAVPLYHFLTDPKEGLPGGELHWSFTKFLIGRDGKPLARYEVGEDPADIDFHVLVEKALAGKLKPHGGKSEEKSSGDDDDDGRR
ncbi:glutathione peroxidase [Terracidiphilus sp.]|jgi:glutathione peroxidase|uniref:glutathione peroxidase n=1 Tax=Terracidiphilus sp. TaxID=1964191 RepID=UPI003C1EE9B6